MKPVEPSPIEQRNSALMPWHDELDDQTPPGPLFRWGQLAMAMVCMATIANMQYGWTLFVHPLVDRFSWTRTSVQVGFTAFVLAQTWLVPLAGYLVDRFGPRPVVLVGGLLCAIGWVMNAFVDSLPLLYMRATRTLVTHTMP